MHKVCLWKNNVCGCAWIRSYTMCSSGINVCVQEKKYDVRNGGREKEIKSSEYMCVNLCVCVNERQGNESLERDCKVLTYEVTAVSCSLSQARHSPHACNIIHAYHTCVHVHMDHTAYIIRTIATLVLYHLLSFGLVCCTTLRWKSSIWNLKKNTKPLNCQGDNVLNRFLASWGIKLLRLLL